MTERIDFKDLVIGFEGESDCFEDKKKDPVNVRDSSEFLPEEFKTEISLSDEFYDWIINGDEKFDIINMSICHSLSENIESYFIVFDEIVGLLNSYYLSDIDMLNNDESKLWANAILSSLINLFPTKPFSNKELDDLYLSYFSNSIIQCVGMDVFLNDFTIKKTISEVDNSIELYTELFYKLGKKFILNNTYEDAMKKYDNSIGKHMADMLSLIK